MRDLYYFAADGSYGNADGMHVLDATYWTDEEWREIEDEWEPARAETALIIATRHADTSIPTLSVVDGSFDPMNETQAEMYLATLESSSYTWRGVGTTPEKALAALGRRWEAEMLRHPEMYNWQEAQEMYGVDVTALHDGFSDRR